MTLVGSGGISISDLNTTKRFDKDYAKLERQLKELVNEKITGILINPMPPGLRFEKLKGYSKPSIYTIHITGNYKVSLEILGNMATLRRVACHDDINRNP